MIKRLFTLSSSMILFILVMLPLCCIGQTTAQVKSSKTNGFHRVLLLPSLRSNTKSDFSDLRIFDSKQTEIPYLIANLNSPIFTRNFDSYKIISQQNLKNDKTMLIIENPNFAQKWSNVSLEIVNTEVNKSFDLSGSSNLESWFGVLNQAQLINLSSSESTSVTKTIQFPLSEYRYLKFEFKDQKSLPIKILSAGTLSNSSSIPSLLPLNPTFSQKHDKLTKKTLVKITFETAQVVDRIALTIDDPSLYNRNARVFIKTANLEEQTISSFNLLSEGFNTFDISQMLTNELFLEVDNQDNIPLNFAEVQLFQQPVYIFADLRANEEYTISAGDSSLTLPNYDLGYFQSKIEASRLVGSITSFRHIQKTVSVKESKPLEFYEKPWFLWLCIGFGALVIGYFAFTLINEMKQTK